MRSALVLTVIGLDRPGIVESLAGIVANFGGNWEESHMARLSGRFAGILRVSVESEKAEVLERALTGLEAAGLRVVVDRRVLDETSGVHRALRLSLIGADRQGIVHDISAALARRGVSLDELETEVRSEAHSGRPLFAAKATLRAPVSLALDELSAALEALANDLMVEVELEATAES